MSIRRRLRVEAGLTQVELAEAAGVSQSSISEFERGVGNPTARKIEAIVLVLAPRLGRSTRDVIAELMTPAGESEPMRAA